MLISNITRNLNRLNLSLTNNSKSTISRRSRIRELTPDHLMIGLIRRARSIHVMTLPHPKRTLIIQMTHRTLGNLVTHRLRSLTRNRGNTISLRTLRRHTTRLILPPHTLLSTRLIRLLQHDNLRPNSRIIRRRYIIQIRPHVIE